MNNHVTVLEIDGKALEHNLHYFKNKLHQNTKILAVVKAFGYGGDGVQIASFLKNKVNYFAVAYAHEGEALRDADIATPILVLHPQKSNVLKIIEYNLEANAYSVNLLKAIIEIVKSDNLQNIPIRTERGKQIRKAFIARDENYTLLSADYSQIELRIIAALCGEENMIKAFQNHEDIHKSTAAKVFNIPLDEVTKEQRSHAKTVNFGIIYGVSAFGLSNQTNLSRKESAELIEAYYQTYPKLKSFIQEQVDFARENGYVETISGRRRYLKDINSANTIVRGGAERNAVNAPIQGSAADIIKIAMINIHKKLSERDANGMTWKSKMLLQVHDELVFDVHNSELEKIQPMIKHEMENAFKMAVPLDVEIGLGKNWLEAH